MSIIFSLKILKNFQDDQDNNDEDTKQFNEYTNKCEVIHKERKVKLKQVV